MRLFRSFAVMLVLVFGVSVSATAGSDWIAYSPETFAEARERHAAVLVDVHADWCPTCRAQKPILDELRAEPELGNVAFIMVSFDDDKEFLQAYRVARQSTIIMFKGTQEVARSVAETDRERLREFVLTAAAR